MDFLTANYHTHTTRCQHAYGTEREYIETAISLGMKKLGFSDHIPCPYKDGYVSGIRMTMEQAPEYVSTIRRLGEEYKHEIEIYVGFEAEYLPEFYEEQMIMFYQLHCDYLIMGQHFTGSEKKGPYSGTPTNDESRIRYYVNSIIEGMKTGSFCCLAHPDLICYEGFDSIYDWEMTRLCRELKEMNIPLELNVLGMGTGKHYPNEQFWKIAGEVGNSVILGLDAHCLDHLKDVNSYEKCMDMVRKFNLQLINDLDF